MKLCLHEMLKMLKVIIDECVCVCVLVAQLCLTLCDPMDYNSPGSSVHGILQARILEWVAILFSRGSFWLRDQTWVSSIVGRFLAIWSTTEWIWMMNPPQMNMVTLKYSPTENRKQTGLWYKQHWVLRPTDLGSRSGSTVFQLCHFLAMWSN